MDATHDNEGRRLYRSRGGLVAFGVWSLVIFAGLVGAAWSATFGGERAAWFGVIGCAALLAASLYLTPLQVVLTSDGNLAFEGLLRRRTWRAADLLHVFPGSFSLVFRFKRGGAVVPSWGEAEWVDLCRRIKSINPVARLNVSGMFRLPGVPGNDADA